MRTARTAERMAERNKDGVFVRSEAQLDRARAAVDEAELPFRIIKGVLAAVMRAPCRGVSVQGQDRDSSKALGQVSAETEPSGAEKDAPGWSRSFGQIYAPAETLIAHNFVLSC